MKMSSQGVNMVNTHIRNIDISTISRGVMKITEEFE